MRVIAGTAGGRRLQVPHGTATRPTGDRVREALFSSLEARRGVSGCRVLDLYAGSGALGLEAMSRGAASAVLVDSAREAIAAIRRNVRDLGLAPIEVVASTVERYLRSAEPPGVFDLVFCDPPYRLSEDDLAEVLRGLVDGNLLARDGLVVVERDASAPDPSWPAGLRPGQARRYGRVVLWEATAAGTG